MSTPSDPIVARAARLDTATLSDALDKLGINGQCYRVKPRSAAFRMTGRAWTLLYGPAGNPAGTVGDYIDDVPPGSMIVLDNGGRDNATVWGDILRGDPDGVVVIPAAFEQQVLDAAEAVEAAESRIREAVRGGMRLDEARKQFKYHQLQTRDAP